MTDTTFAQAALAYRSSGKNVRFLDLIEDYWKDTRIRDISSGAIIAMAKELYPERAASTVNRQGIVPAQAIINHAAELDWCRPIRVKRLKEEEVLRFPTSAAWVTSFANQALKDDLQHLAALCVFLFGTGARISEALSLVWRDVELSVPSVRIRQTKTSAERISHLPPPVVAALARLPGSRHPEDSLFTYAARGSVYKTWHGVISRAGIEYLTPHSCRHGFATTLLHRGIDVKTVAELGGWQDAATVLKYYAHAMTDKKITDLLFDANLTQVTNQRQAVA